jgi:adenylate kinase
LICDGGLIANLTSLCYSGYALKKIQENNEAEIMQTVLEEAHSSYPSEIIVELQSSTPDEMDSNVDRIVEWVKNWRTGRDLSESPQGDEAKED